MCNEQSTITKQMIINILQPKPMGNQWAIGQSANTRSSQAPTYVTSVANLQICVTTNPNLILTPPHFTLPKNVHWKVQNQQQTIENQQHTFKINGKSMGSKMSNIQIVKYKYIFYQRSTTSCQLSFIFAHPNYAHPHPYSPFNCLLMPNLCMAWYGNSRRL